MCVCVLIFNATVKLLKKSVVDKPTAAIFLAVLVGSAVMDVSPVCSSSRPQCWVSC